MAPENALIARFPRIRARIIVLEHDSELCERQLAAYGNSEETLAEANRATIMLNNATNELHELRQLLADWDTVHFDGRIIIPFNATVLALIVFATSTIFLLSYMLLGAH
jgi:hypothetical protein